MSKKEGFTLIELLITISIIAILSAIGLVSYSVVMKQGRDSKRQSDLRSIQSALEQYYADKHNYPLLSSSSTCPSDGTLKFGCALKDPIGNRTYMNTVPNDSNLTTPYAYIPLKSDNTLCNTAANVCTTYCLFAKLENTPPPSGSCNWSGQHNFGVGPP